jgi:P-type Ca2+ transporter type 2C
MESIVTSGSGIMLVLSTGKRTFYHKSIYSLFINIPDPTPLQFKVQDLSEKIGKYGTSAAAIIFFGQLGHLFYDCFGRNVSYGATGFAYHILHFIVVSITVAVFAIPEGLPVIVTLGLAHRLENMAYDKNLVMKLESIFL